MIPETRDRTRSDSPRTGSSAGGPSEAAGSAFESLVHRHHGLVRRAVRSALRGFGAEPDADRVADLEQEVWCRLLERHRRRRPGPRERHEGETVHYLRKVVRSAVVDAVRAAAAAKRRPAGWVPIDEPAGGRGLEDLRGDPERRLLALDELRRQVRLWRRQLGKHDLPVRLRIVRLAWVFGFSSAEIARRVGAGWTVSGVDSLLCRLRRKLVARGESHPVRGPAIG